MGFEVQGFKFKVSGLRLCLVDGLLWQHDAEDSTSNFELRTYNSPTGYTISLPAVLDTARVDPIIPTDQSRRSQESGARQTRILLSLLGLPALETRRKNLLR